MSANDILDVLNISRDDNQPAKKKQKTSTPTDNGKPLTGMARELYNLVGPNTPPINLSSSNYISNKGKQNRQFRPSPWSKVNFTPGKHRNIQLKHWVKGSEELLKQENESDEKKEYFFEKFNIKLDIPEFIDEEKYETYMNEFKDDFREEQFTKRKAERMRQLEEQKKQKKIEEKKEEEKRLEEKKEAEKQEEVKQDIKKEGETKQEENFLEEKKEEQKMGEKSVEPSVEPSKEPSEPVITEEEQRSEDEKIKEEVKKELVQFDWSYQETKELFNLCQIYELKWPTIHDRFPSNHRVEDLKEQFYRICVKILETEENKNQNLIDSLKAFSKPRELERKQYLENLLKRTPAEIAEEESLVIEARRFELAAKKMLLERSNLLTLLDSPQSTQNVSQYQSSQGISNLYNNLMIYDKHQKKKQAHQQKQEPIPPPIPLAASSSIRRDKVFQTNLQQYLASFLKQAHHTNPAIKQEANSIQQLLSKRLTQKEEEAYGLHYHGTEKLTPGVTLRSQQKLPGSNQRQSVLKSVSAVFQEMDLPTAGGTMWKPVMPTRKTMSKYDELLRSVVTMLDIKRAKDKLEAEIKLIKSQKGMQ
ncbi:unnamed protein product [Candida verbasci]|uniref:SWR1-complex protein 4 n=1 Tax=Candida verbasci TaxID=1227364 RepID=A0A9W4TQI8_9ASCO|nr:unnamed protein product [Candida verbasci]